MERSCYGQGIKAGNIIDMKYYRTLVDDAKDQINKYGDSERFCA